MVLSDSLLFLLKLSLECGRVVLHCEHLALLGVDLPLPVSLHTVHVFLFGPNLLLKSEQFLLHPLVLYLNMTDVHL